jgi:O-antigen/teichoic acid export membrane protein
LIFDDPQYSILMPSEIRTVGRHTLVYGVGVVASKLVSFIMLPVYTRFLTTADYGVIELLGTTIDIIGMIGGIGLAAGVFKHYAELKGKGERNELISTATLGSTGISILITCLGLIASPLLTKLLFGDNLSPLYFRLFFLIYFFQNLGNLSLIFVQAEERSGLFVALNVAKLFATLALTIWLVVALRWGIRGVLVANLCATAAFSTGLVIYTLRRVGFQFSHSQFVLLSRFGAPVALWTIGSFILTFSDRYFLNHYSGASAVGVYSLAYKFSFLLTAFAVAPFNQIWEPRRFVIAHQPDAAEIYRRMFIYLNLALFIGSIVIALFVKDFLTVLVAPAFLPAYRVIPLLLVTTIIQQWTGYANLGLYLKNSTYLYGASAVIGVIAALVLNMLLIPRYGMFGAAWATVGAYFIRFIPVYMLSQAKYHVTYAWGKVSELALLFAGVLLVRYVADSFPLPISFSISLVVLAVVGAFAYRRLLDRDEQAFVRAVARRPLSFRAIPVVQDVT